MLKILVIIALVFTAVEAAHLNYHVQQDVNRSNIDKNFWSLISYKLHWSIPHGGMKICHCRSLRSLPLHRVHAVLYCTPTCSLGERAKRAALSITVRIRIVSKRWYEYEKIKTSVCGWTPVNVLSTTCWQQRHAVPYCMHTDETDTHAQDWTSDVRCYRQR